MRAKGYRLPRVRRAVCSVRGHAWQPQPGGIRTCDRCKVAEVPEGLATIDDMVVDYPAKEGR
jgi:hypothetical protein